MAQQRPRLGEFTRNLPGGSKLKAFKTVQMPSMAFGDETPAAVDVNSIAKLDKIVLTGLDFSMRPEKARYEATKGFIKPLPEQMVMHRIKSLAIVVYNQEKMTPMYHANVCETGNPLAYFICAMHRQAAPQPQKKKNKHTSISSTSSSDSTNSCKSAKPGKNCELPNLVTTSMLPLGYWDSLYYALLSEIRQLYGDLQAKYGWSMEHGTTPLHNEGLDAVHKEPITAIDLAAILETAWYELMDHRLVATLDDAVRLRKMRENASKKHNSLATQTSEDEAAYSRPPVMEGLLDINGLTAEAIVEILWFKHAPEVDEACRENFEDESMHTAYRASLHAQQLAMVETVRTPPPAQTSCRCHSMCICRTLRCDRYPDHCTCRAQVNVYSVIDGKGDDDQKTRTFVKQDKNKPLQSLGVRNKQYPHPTMQKELPQASNSTFIPKTIQGHREHTEDLLSGQRNAPSRLRSRSRANTNNSELAYVPETRPSQRRGKDAYPLGLYGEGSPGRYPKVSEEPAAMPMRSQTVTNFDVQHPEMPMRKPVPPPPVPKVPAQYVSPETAHGSITPPSSGRYGTAQPDHLAWPVLLATQSQNIVTQSFPVTEDNPRQADNDPFVEQTTSYDPAQDYVGLLTRHPSSLEPEPKSAPPPVPSLTRAATTTPPRKAKTFGASSSNLRHLDQTTYKASSDLPPPSFIAPRPATVQRYVSAGGNAKLEDREEIPGPAFASDGPGTPLEGNVSGAGMTPEQLKAAMTNDEWVSQRFGSAAIEKAAELKVGDPSAARPSGDTEATRSRAGSAAANQRDRTSSGVARKILDKVFRHKQENKDENKDEKRHEE